MPALFTIDGASAPVPENVPVGVSESVPVPDTLAPVGLENVPETLSGPLMVGVLWFTSVPAIAPPVAVKKRLLVKVPARVPPDWLNAVALTTAPVTEPPAKLNWL